jgi:fucose 4-O-acetylase-like acetyltransferase
MPNGRKDTQALSTDLFCMRGIGILLVVLVHVLGVDASHGVRKLFTPDRMDLRRVVELIHSFNMAVMLMGSGVAVAAFGRAELTLREFLRKKVNKLFIPMLVWAPMLFLIQGLLRGAFHGQGWLEVLRRVPSTWFPAYAIFWFVHALAGCTLLAWGFRRFAAPALGRWSEAVYLGLSVGLYLAVSAWTDVSPGRLSEYVEFILYWNRFFALGMWIHPWLTPARQALGRAPVMIQGLVPVGFFSLVALVYTVVPAEQYEWVRTINGPLGFCMLFSLAAFLRHQVSEWGEAWREAWSRLAHVGSLSMILYLFHLYFVSGMRVALERWHSGTPVAVHLVAGVLAGCMGPWALFHILKGQPVFQWSVGLSLQASKPREQEGRLRDGLAPIR